MKKVYLIKTPDGKISVWSSMKKFCDNFGFAYSTVAIKDYPFKYKGYWVAKLFMNQE